MESACIPEKYLTIYLLCSNQYNKYGKETDQTGWLFNFGNKEKVEKDLYDWMIKRGGTYETADVREKLILLSLLKQKAGDDSFTKMYQEYRKLASQPNFKHKDYPLPELMNRIYSENSLQDFTPVFEKWGITVGMGQAEKNRFSGYPAVASLADVVPEHELTRARQLVDPAYLINSNFEMVRNDEIAELKLKGDLTVLLNTDDSSTLTDIKVTLKDGSKKIATQDVQGQKVTFKNVPNGVYHLEFSGKTMGSYAPETVYVYVKEAQNQATIEMNRIKISQLANQTIEFLGVSDEYFGSLSTNMNKKEVVISITEEDPHYFFEGEVYLTISIKDRTGKVKYAKTIEGTNTQVGKDKISLHEGDIIDIYHAETKNRLVSSERIIDTTQNTNRWIMTNLGLQNHVLKNDLDKDFEKKIDALGSLLLAQEKHYPIPFEQSNMKKQLRAAIELIKNRDTFMAKYSILFK